MNNKDNNFISREERVLLLDSAIIEQCPEWFRQFLKDNLRITNGLVDSLPPKQRDYVRNRTHSLVATSEGEWMKDPGKRHKDLGLDRSDWTHCSLSNTRIRHVFFILNKCNGKQNQVGRECVTHFKNVLGGKSVDNHVQEMERQRLLDDIEQTFPGAERMIENWKQPLEKLPVVLSFELEKTYISLRKRLKQVIVDYTNQRTHEFNEIGQILDERKSVLAEIDSFVAENKDKKYAAGIDIAHWLLERGKSPILRHIKQQGGMITKDSAPHILAPNFVKLIEPALDRALSKIGAEIQSSDVRRGTYVLELRHNKKVLLEVPHRQLVSRCAAALFPGDEHQSQSRLDVQEIISFAAVPRNQVAINNFIGQLQMRVKFTGASIMKHNIKYMDILIYEKRAQRYIVADIEPFLDRFIELALGINAARNEREYLFYVQSLSNRRYTQGEIDARFDRYARPSSVQEPVSG